MNIIVIRISEFTNHRRREGYFSYGHNGATFKGVLSKTQGYAVAQLVEALR